MIKKTTSVALILLGLSFISYFLYCNNNINDFYKLAKLNTQQLTALLQAPNNYTKLGKYSSIIIDQLDKLDKEKLLKVAQNIDKHYPAFALDLAGTIIFNSKLTATFGNKLYENPSIIYSSNIDPQKENIFLGDFDGFLTIFNLKQNKVTKRFKIKEEKDIIYMPDSITFHPKNENIIAVALSAGGGKDEKEHAEIVAKSSIVIWDLKTNSIVTELKDNKDHVKQVLFSNDGSMLASCSDDKTIKVYDTKTWKLKYSFDEHSGYVFNISFNSASTLLASSAWDGKVIIWNLRNGKKKTELELIVNPKFPYYENPDEIAAEKMKYNKVTAVKFYPKNDNIFASAENNVLQEVDINTNKILKLFNGSVFPIVGIEFDNTLNYVFILNENGHILNWNIENQKQQKVFPGMHSPYNKILFVKDNNIIFTYGLNFKSSFLFQWKKGLNPEKPLEEVIKLITN